jgi:hypothetical protein
MRWQNSVEEIHGLYLLSDFVFKKTGEECIINHVIQITSILEIPFY